MNAVFVRRSKDLIRRRLLAREYGAWKQETRVTADPSGAKKPARRSGGKGKRRSQSG